MPNLTDSNAPTTGARPLPGGLANLPPAYFGMVMATGIVSLAAWQMGFTIVALVTFGLNVLVYVTLWILNVVRVMRYPARYLADLFDHHRAPGFFTFVAATSILGSQFVLLADQDMAGFIFCAVASVLWIGLTYAIFTALTVKEDKPTLEQGISGAWLLAVVATQSIAVLAALLAARIAQPYRIELNFLALSMWLCGGMLYIWMMSLIFYRYTFFRFLPGDLSPPYWINMGAMAISTLAGARLIANTDDAPFLESILPFLKGFTVFYWATGTWWIPMLLILGIWRHVYKRYPLTYDPLYWGAVFPLGMYAVSTRTMLEQLKFEFLGALPVVFFWIALTAWSITFVALLFSLLRSVRTRAPRHSEPVGS